MLIRLNNLLDHLLAVTEIVVLELGGHGHFLVVFRTGAASPAHRVHGRPAPNEVNGAAKLLFLAHRQLDGNGIAVQSPPDGVEGSLVAGAHTVHLVDEADAGNGVGVSLPPNGFRLRLHSGHCVKNNNTAVKYAQRTLHFGGEIYMPRGVDDIDPAVLPLGSGGGSRYGNAPLSFLGHPVHCGGPVIHAAHPVDAACSV